ncbi:MAG: Spy/CpxP family protein refolding chaperone [Rhodospirillales bacterium]|nr:Spy/CpxP family protein refolding chaperone [Rhodospirillales bacterium]MDE2575084.1 Spy/CpxP family protein refolding chaperone [Rhodospirillales bacterium]
MTRTKLRATAALFAVLALPVLPAAAQTAAPPPTTMPARPTRPDRLEQHIATLHRQLRITAAQQPQWDAFAQTMRDNAQAMRADFQQRGAALAGMSAADNMRSYADLAEQHARNMQKLAASFQVLYDTMSPAQKHNADTVFQARAAHPGPAPRKN